MAPGGAVRYEMDRTFALAVSGTLFALRDSLYNMLLFAALLVGTVFFIAAGSFLYFRLYADLDFDRRHYATISRLGMTDREFRRIVTGQLALLFLYRSDLRSCTAFCFHRAAKLFLFIHCGRNGHRADQLPDDAGPVLFFIRSQYLRKLKQTLI